MLQLQTATVTVGEDCETRVSLLYGATMQPPYRCAAEVTHLLTTRYVLTYFFFTEASSYNSFATSVYVGRYTLHLRNYLVCYAHDVRFLIVLQVRGDPDVNVLSFPRPDRTFPARGRSRVVGRLPDAEQELRRLPA